MTGKDFARPKRKDRFAIDYELTKGEKVFVFFYTRITAVLIASGLFYWALQIATR